MNIRISGVAHTKPFGFKDPSAVRRIVEQLFNESLIDNSSPDSWGNTEFIVYAVTDTKNKELTIKGPDKSKKYIEFGVWLPSRLILKFDKYDVGYGIYLIKGIIEILGNEKIIGNTKELEQEIMDGFARVINTE
jgi:hypothetical protein